MYSLIASMLELPLVYKALSYIGIRKLHSNYFNSQCTFPKVVFNQFCVQTAEEHEVSF